MDPSCPAPAEKIYAPRELVLGGLFLILGMSVLLLNAMAQAATRLVRAWGEMRGDDPRPRVVVFDGEIGAGKTTVIEMVRRALEREGRTVTVVPEPVEDWKRTGILQEFYRAAGRRDQITYEFQTYTFVTRLLECVRRAEAAPAEIYLCERSVWTDRHVFMELHRGTVGPMRMAMYEKWWALWARLMPFAPTKIVYLKPTLANCMARVAKRARAGEVPSGDAGSARGGVTVEYQRDLRAAHEAYLEGKHPGRFPGMPPCPLPAPDVVVLEGPLVDTDYLADPGAAGRLVREIVRRACR